MCALDAPRHGDHTVVALGLGVAGIVDDDQKAAARLAVIEYRDEFVSKGTIERSYRSVRLPGVRRWRWFAQRRSESPAMAEMAAAAPRRWSGCWGRFKALRSDSFDGKVEDGEAELWSYPSVLEVAGDDS